jgi:hypothetical protein
VSTNLIAAVCQQACSSLARDQVQRFLGHFFHATTRCIRCS